jgi:type I restriction-modification system DNA methylase subunit
VLADVLAQPRADQFDLLAHLAFGKPLRTRDDRADAFMNREQRFLQKYDSRAREVVVALLDKYRLSGVTEITSPDVFRLSPFREMGQAPGVIAKWTAEDLLRFVHGDLLPHLQNLSGSPEREVIKGIFSDRNVVVCASPYNLKDVLDIVDGIDFTNQDDIHTVSHVYEGLLQKLGNENKLAGEFYTPRPVIRFVVDVVAPQLGGTVYDPAAGSCGFLVQAYEHMKGQEKSRRDHVRLQRETFVGHEKKSVPALLGLMNMVLHGVMTPDIRRLRRRHRDCRGDRRGRRGLP